MSPNNESKIIKSEYWFEDESKLEEVKKDSSLLFKTQEKKIAIFLYARGYKLRGLEKKIIKTTNGNSKTIIVFCFDNNVGRARLEFYNINDNSVFNVNAKSILEAQQDITSMIVNF